MLESLPRHGCGGELEPTGFAISRTLGMFLFTFQHIPGRRCSQCAIEIIDRDMALALETLEQESIQDFINERVEVEYCGSMFTTNVPGISFDSGIPSDTAVLAMA